MGRSEHRLRLAFLSASPRQSLVSNHALVPSKALRRLGRSVSPDRRGISKLGCLRGPRTDRGRNNETVPFACGVGPTLESSIESFPSKETRSCRTALPGIARRRTLLRRSAEFVRRAGPSSRSERTGAATIRACCSPAATGCRFPLQSGRGSTYARSDGGSGRQLSTSLALPARQYGCFR